MSAHQWARAVGKKKSPAKARLNEQANKDFESRLKKRLIPGPYQLRRSHASNERQPGRGYPQPDWRHEHNHRTTITGRYRLATGSRRGLLLLFSPRCRRQFSAPDARRQQGLINAAGQNLRSVYGEDKPTPGEP